MKTNLQNVLLTGTSSSSVNDGPSPNTMHLLPRASKCVCLLPLPDVDAETIFILVSTFLDTGAAHEVVVCHAWA